MTLTEKANRNLKFVYNPAVQKWEPETKITGTPTKAYNAGVLTSTTILTVAAGTFFALTDLILTNAVTAAVTVTISDGSNAVLSVNLAAGATTVIQFQTPLVFTTSVTASANGATNIMVSGITAQ